MDARVILRPTACLSGSSFAHRRAILRAWSAALGRSPAEMPHITATKSLVGHGLGAAGGLEAVASVLMVREGFLHPCLNCEDVHPDIEPFAASIPHEMQEAPDLRVLVKASFGFGDVNACLVMGRWSED